jgi:Ca-activated chloride channel family protein
LLSDGVANVGNTGADSILNQLENYKKQGITLTAIGVGMGNLNDALLEQLADKGDGNYYYINDFSEAKKVFSAQLTGTLQVIAKDAKIQVDFNPDAVEKYRLIGYENRAIADESFRDDSKDAGEIGMGHEVTAIYEVQLRSKTENLARVYMRYKNPENSIAKEIAQDITPSSIKNSFESGTSRFKMAISAARFAQILKLTSPPPSINKVIEIVNSIEQIDDAEKDFKIVLSNAKGLIEAKQGGN